MRLCETVFLCLAVDHECCFFVKSKTMKDGCIVSLIMNRVLPGFIEMG